MLSPPPAIAGGAGAERPSLARIGPLPVAILGPWPIRAFTPLAPSSSRVAALALAALLAAPARAAWPGREGPVVYAGVFPGTTLKPSLTRPAGLRRFTPECRRLARPAHHRHDRSQSAGLTRRPPRRLLAGHRGPRRARTLGDLRQRDRRQRRQAADRRRAPPKEPIPNPPSRLPARASSSSAESAGPFVSGDLYSIGLDGSGLTPLTSGPAADRMPAVSPTGRQIVFVRSFQSPDGIEVGTPRLLDAARRLPASRPHPALGPGALGSRLQPLGQGDRLRHRRQQPARGHLHDARQRRARSAASPTALPTTAATTTNRAFPGHTATPTRPSRPPATRSSPLPAAAPAPASPVSGWPIRTTHTCFGSSFLGSAPAWAPEPRR